MFLFSKKDRPDLLTSRIKKLLFLPELLLIGLLPSLLMLFPDKKLSQLSNAKILSIIGYTTLLWGGLLLVGMLIGFLSEGVRSYIRNHFR